MAPRAFSPYLRLVVVLDAAAAGGRPLGGIARQAVSGGATMLQVRAKSATTRQLLELTVRVIEIARERNVPVIMNDRADVALITGADGVHLGEDDLPVAAARRILGPEAIVGFSAGTPRVARLAQLDGADYLGAGDVFGTASKLDADPPIGLAGLSAVAAATDLPVVAIGGIGPENAADAVRAGAVGVAVISAVVRAGDICGAARTLRAVVDGAADGS